jgi:hypothetical protein
MAQLDSSTINIGRMVWHISSPPLAACLPACAPSCLVFGACMRPCVHHQASNVLVLDNLNIIFM